MAAFAFLFTRLILMKVERVDDFWRRSGLINKPNATEVRWTLIIRGPCRESLFLIACAELIQVLHR